MNWARPCTILTALLLGACGGMPDCQKPQIYQEAVPGKRIELLEGMDNLSADRELTIPKASPDAPPPPGECLDAPPTMRTASDEG
ncbi:MAG: hypothetical protein WD078_14430 [Woeseia sp.]